MSITLRIHSIDGNDNGTLSLGPDGDVVMHPKGKRGEIALSNLLKSKPDETTAPAWMHHLVHELPGRVSYERDDWTADPHGHQRLQLTWLGEPWATVWMDGSRLRAVPVNPEDQHELNLVLRRVRSPHWSDQDLFHALPEMVNGKLRALPMQEPQQPSPGQYYGNEGQPERYAEVPRVPAVSPHVIEGYDRAFSSAIRNLAGRVKHPGLAEELHRWAGNHNLTNYIIGAFKKEGLDRKYDVHAILNHAAEEILHPTKGVFSGFQDRDTPTEHITDLDNPARLLRSRFNQKLAWTIDNLHNPRRRGNERFKDVGRAPGGSTPVHLSTPTLSTGERTLAESLPEQPSRGVEADYHEMTNDLRGMLDGPARNLFEKMLAGEPIDNQKGGVGFQQARQGVLDAVRRYAESTGNLALAKGLEQALGERASTVAAQKKGRKLARENPQEAESISVTDAIANLLGHTGSATWKELRKARTRQAKRPPRDASSPHRTRLEEIVADLVTRGVLQDKGGEGGQRELAPGLKWNEYRGSR